MTFSDGTPVERRGGRDPDQRLADAAELRVRRRRGAHHRASTAVTTYVVRFNLDQANVAFPSFLASGAGSSPAPAAWAAAPPR